MTLTSAGETVAMNVKPNAHWIPTNKSINDQVNEMEKIKSRRPLWSINRQAYSSGRGRYLTEFADSFGVKGDNPRNVLPYDALR